MMNAIIKTQKFGLGEILSEGWRIYRAQFVKILVITLCVHGPINLILAFVPLTQLMDTYGSRGVQIYQNIDRLLEFLIGTVAIIALAYLVEKAYEEKETTWVEALRYGVFWWPNAIGTGLLGGLILLGLTLLLIVPGIIWGVYYSFWVYVVALRVTSGKAALDYSKNLVKGQWWRVVGIQLVIGLIAFVTGLIIAAPFLLLPASPVVDIVSGLLANIAGSLFTVMTIVFFLNVDYLKHPEAETAVDNVVETQPNMTV
jgi:hypothetical protein